MKQKQLPGTILPMEPVQVEKPPQGPGFLHSVKWDGVRQLLYLESDSLRIHNRKLKNRTAVYPELDTIREMAIGTGHVFDGEVVALNEEGKPDFQRVMRRDGCKSQRAVTATREVVPVYYCIFDLLYYQGESIMELPLTKRLDLLAEVLPKPEAPILVVEHLKDGKSLFQKTKELGLEGVVSKEASGRYLPGTKSSLWVKAKHYREMVVVVGGFTEKNGFLNALSVGTYGEDGWLYYLGNVATGISQGDFTVLDRELRGVIQSASPFVDFNKKTSGQFWTIPLLRLRVKYLELTSQGHLRHPVVLGFVPGAPGHNPGYNPGYNPGH